jgi:hypothetical protein
MCRNILQKRYINRLLDDCESDWNHLVMLLQEYDRVVEPITLDKGIVRKIQIDRAIAYFVPRASLVIGFSLPIILTIGA